LNQRGEAALKALNCRGLRITLILPILETQILNFESVRPAPRALEGRAEFPFSVQHAKGTYCEASAVRWNLCLISENLWLRNLMQIRDPNEPDYGVYRAVVDTAKTGTVRVLRLNPDSASKLAPDVTFIAQDCSQPWPLPDEHLDVVSPVISLSTLPRNNISARPLTRHSAA
jgi:hypothetical protein